MQTHFTSWVKKEKSEKNEMDDKPILFSAPMVREVRADRKIKTRRVLTRDPSGLIGAGFDDEYLLHPENQGWREKCFPWQVGTILWIREGLEWVDGKICYSADHAPVDCTEAPDGYMANKSKVPSIFMPRWACRDRIEVTDMELQRLKDITLDDIRAEGVGHGTPDQFLMSEWVKLWDGLNAKRKKGIYAWKANPWITVTTFRRRREAGELKKPKTK